MSGCRHITQVQTAHADFKDTQRDPTLCHYGRKAVSSTCCDVVEAVVGDNPAERKGDVVDSQEAKSGGADRELEDARPSPIP